jgi:hypothetical protein
MQKVLALAAPLGYSLGMSNTDSIMTPQMTALLADLAACTARFEAMAERIHGNAKTFVQDLKDDREKIENMKKVLA